MGSTSIDPKVAKVGGLQSQGVKGEDVVGYLESLTTQDLKFSGFPAGKQFDKIDPTLLVPS
jgi:hypothetical protein